MSRVNEMNTPTAGVNEPFFGMNVNNPGVQAHICDALDELTQCGLSREFSIVKTKLEEALLWLKAAERGEMTSSS